MKKTFYARILILNVLLALTFTACKKEDDDDVDLDPVSSGALACQLVKSAYEGDDDYTEFEYNAQGYLSKAHFREIGSAATNNYLLFTYNTNNQVIKTEYFDNGQKDGSTTYEYTNDLLTTAKDFAKNGTINQTTTYKYDSSKRMIEEESDGDISRYTYDSKNNISQEERIYLGKVVSRKTYENYDDKISPFASVPGFPLFLAETSKNNPGKTVSTYDQNQDGILQASETETSTFAYKYNDKGFTTEIRETSGTETDITTYAYNCK